MADEPCGSGKVERRFQRILVPLPYILLGVPTLLSLAESGQSGRDQLTTLGLAAAAGAWALFMYTLRGPSWTGRTTPMLVYVGGQLALAGVLMGHRPLFFVFAVIGFIQAYEVLPPLWAFISIAVTSVLLNTIPGGLPNNAEWITFTVIIICLQIFFIGWFGYLGHRFNEQSEQRRQTVARLEAALAENAGLHAQLLIQAREAGIHDERQRMAREIHDTLAQGLTGIITQLQAADRAREHPAQWQRHLDHVQALARDSLAAARRSVAAMRPAELEGSHLPAAIADFAARWSQTSGVVARVETTGEPRPMLAEIEVTLFRVAQEALANVAKHAGATKVGLTLSYVDDAVMLDVRDDGVGFVLAASSTGVDGSGFGLSGMRQRVERVAGSLTIESAPGEGTAVNASVPTVPLEGVPLEGVA